MDNRPRNKGVDRIHKSLKKYHAQKVCASADRNLTFSVHITFMELNYEMAWNPQVTRFFQLVHSIYEINIVVKL